MQTLSYNEQIETELDDREWALFNALKQWSQLQRDNWRMAWRSWRQEQLSTIHNGKARIQVRIESSCIGCFDCEIMCSDIFKIIDKRSRINKDVQSIGPDNKSYINPKILSSCFEDLHLAKEACPVEAIHVINIQTTNPEPLPEHFV